MIKLLIVDDSALMRRQLTALFKAEGDFEIRQAHNGAEAVAQNREFAPDVVTLDINMPEMDGITALSLIMAERPVPVVMVSSLTEKGALATLEALNLGAVDYVAKPGGTISLSIHEIEADLVAKVRAAAGARLGQVRPRTRSARRPADDDASDTRPRSASATRGLGLRLRTERQRQATALAQQARQGSDNLLLIGVSTGGPRALEDLLPALPADFPWPVLVAQHMPASFTGPFAQRLNTVCPLEVQEVTAPTPISSGHIYIARGAADMVLTRRGGALTALPKPASAAHLWHPSVDVLGHSALQHVKARNLVAVLLTGMGDDGAEAFAQIHQGGGRTIAESQESAVVFGMPAALIQRGGASVVLPLDRIAEQINAWADAPRTTRT